MKNQVKAWYVKAGEEILRLESIGPNFSGFRLQGTNFDISSDPVISQRPQLTLKRNGDIVNDRSGKVFAHQDDLLLSKAAVYYLGPNPKRRALTRKLG